MKNLSILFIVFMLLFSSCGKDCHKDKKYTYMPQEFHDKIAGMKTHDRWIFSNGSGLFDTLTAAGPVSQSFWQEGSPCDLYEQIDRRYTWDVYESCIEEKQLTLDAVVQKESVSYYLLSSIYSSTPCIGMKTDYQLSTHMFNDQISFDTSFSTPYKNYTQVTALRYYRRPYVPVPAFEVMIFNDADGLIGYTLKGDTMRLIDLK